MVIIDRYKNCLIQNKNEFAILIRPVLADEAKKRKKPTIEDAMIVSYKAYKLCKNDITSVLLHYNKFHRLGFDGDLSSKFIATFGRENYNTVAIKESMIKEILSGLDYYIHKRLQK